MASDNEEFDVELSCNSSSSSEELDIDSSISPSESFVEVEAEENDGKAGGDAVDLGVQAYMFEPVAEIPEAAENDEEAMDQPNLLGLERLQNTEWCTCSQCTALPLVEECRCCREIEEVTRLMDKDIRCITDHEGFRGVCLNVWVLQTAFYAFRQYHRHAAVNVANHAINEKYRYIAYRQFVRWCWGYLGEKHRVPLPSCVINKIRTTFPSADYAGFQYPTLER